MTTLSLHTLFAEAQRCADRDAFASEWALSSVFDGDPRSPAELAELCGRIWDLAHITVAAIRKTTGLSQAAFATRFLIPRRTVENWESGVNDCPIYTRLLLARACSLMDGIE